MSSLSRAEPKDIKNVEGQTLEFEKNAPFLASPKSFHILHFTCDLPRNR